MASGAARDRATRRLRGVPLALIAACMAQHVGASRLPLISHAPRFSRQTVTAGDWRLNVARTLFSGDVRCRLAARNGRAIFVADAVGFHFGKGADVLDAWFRIDDGAPVRWRDVLPELAAAGVAIDGRTMDAPTGGVVWIPLARLTDAERVTVQPRPDRGARRFSMRGFDELRAAAASLGCVPETRFVR